MYREKITFSKHQTRKALLTEAKSWVGTPYQHQARLKHVGVDCVNLVIAVGMSVGVLDLTRHDLKAFSGYGRLPNPRMMGKYMKKYLTRVADVQIGDIAWIQWRADLPMHLAIIGEHDNEPTLIHAYADARQVVEHGLTDDWKDRIVSFWRYPGLV